MIPILLFVQLQVVVDKPVGGVFQFRIISGAFCNRELAHNHSGKHRRIVAVTGHAHYGKPAFSFAGQFAARLLDDQAVEHLAPAPGVLRTSGIERPHEPFVGGTHGREAEPSADAAPRLQFLIGVDRRIERRIVTVARNPVRLETVVENGIGGIVVAHRGERLGDHQMDFRRPV